jgi:hypothetical protein
MRYLTITGIVLSLVLSCSAAPKAITGPEAKATAFDLSADYVIANPLLKEKTVIAAGRYMPWYKDDRGVYYGQDGKKTMVFISFAKDDAWSAVVNEKIHVQGTEMPAGIPKGAIQAVTTVLIAELLLPKPGSVSKQMRCKKDFLKLIAWASEDPKSELNQPLHGTPAKAPSSSTEPEGRRP